MLQIHFTIDDQERSLAVLEALTKVLGGQVSTTPDSASQPVAYPGLPVAGSVAGLPPAGVPAAAVPPAPVAPAPAAPVPETPAAAPPAAVPTSPPAYTMDQLAVAATQLMDAGRQQELIGLLNSFGVQALTSLPKEQYGAFATHLRAMGARL